VLAAVFTGNEQLELRQVPTPLCPPGGLLIRVTAAAICATDIKTLRRADVKLKDGKERSMALPRVLGHKFAGHIAERGADVQEFTVGERVVIAPTVPCGSCHYCRRGFAEMCDRLRVFGYDWDGGFSEFACVEKDVLDAGCVIRIPDNVADQHACLAEPISCALNCLELSPVAEGDTVAIIGTGPLGVIIADLAKWKGARTVVVADRSAEQIEAARVSAADIYVNTSTEDLKTKIDELTGGRGVEVLIVACSAPEAQADVLHLIAKRGKINLFAGLPRGNSTVCWDTNMIHYAECSVTGTHGSQPVHVREALALLESGAIQAAGYISHTFALSQIHDTLKIAKSMGRLKVVITP